MCALPVTIKSFFVVLLYFTEPVASTRSVFENLRPHPWFFTQRIHPKRFVTVPRPSSRPDLPKIMYWKHLLELECIKELCQYRQDSLARKNPFEIIRQKQIPAFRNDYNHRESLKNYRTKENQFTQGPQDRRKYFGSENKIFRPPDRIITGKKSNVSATKQEFRQSESFKPPLDDLSGSHKSRTDPKDSGVLRDNIKQMLPMGYGEPSEEVQNSKIINEKESGRWADPKELSLANLLRNSGLVKSSTPHNFKQSVNSDRILPYEVEEFFEENLEVDVDGDRDESFKTFKGQKFFEEKAWEKEVTRTETKAENEKLQNFIGDSVNTILRRLMVTPMAKAVSPADSEISRDNLPLVKAEKEPPWSAVNTKSFGFRTFAGYPKDETPWKHQETHSGLKKVPTPKPSERFNLQQKNPKVTQNQNFKPDNTRADSSRGFDFTSNSKKESFRDFLTTDSPKAAEAFELPPYDTRHTQSDLVEGSEKYIPLPHSDTLNTVKVMKNLNADQEPLTAEDSRQQTAEDSRQQAAEDSRQQTAEHSRQQTGEHSRQQTTEHSRQQTTEHSRQQAAEDSRQQAAEHSRQQAAEHSRQQAAEHSRQQAAEHSRQQAAEHSRQQAAEDSRQQAAEHSRQQTAEVNPTVQSTSERSSYPTTASFSTVTVFLEESAARSSYGDSGTMITEVDSFVTTRDFVSTVESITKSNVSVEEKTEDGFVEFTDHPETFDLFNTTINSSPKKPQETTWKNSRKMNFEQETIEVDEAEQRRSDILISDNLADYADDENSISTIGYIEKLKQNSSTEYQNLTTEDFLPLIPVIINDLREGKIPTEDYPILSRALGKYWSPVLALSNFTNLDMLPLLKMKSEKDLNNFLQSFLPQNLTTPGTANEDEVDDYYNSSYDYVEEYKEMYKDILGQDFGDKKRRFRPRRDAEDDLKTLEATREYFESIAEESSEGESDYFFEDIMYDEVSDSEDTSVFELMEVAGVHTKKET